MIGAGPFSRARCRAASQPAIAISRDTSSVNATDSGEPYFMPSSVSVLPRPRKPMPWRRLRVISSRCCSRGRPLISTTLSSMRGEHFHDFAILDPVELGEFGERLAHEAGEVHRAQQAAAVGRQRLLAARIGGADVLAPPVVVHLVDPVDQDEAGLREIVGGRHDHVPHAARRQRLVDLAGDQAFLVGHVGIVDRPLAPHELARIAEIGLLRLVLLQRERESQLPVAVLAHGLHELVGDEQREIELPEPCRFRAWRG